MSARRIAVLAATAAAVALPVVSAPAATAAPAHASSSATSVKAYGECDRVGPYKLHAKAVNIRSKASSSSTKLGVLYKSHKFKVHSTTKSGSWVNITDRKTGVRGWVSGAYVYPTVYTCLH
ncbi:SH3 domain-containing protein [Streptomyces sp. NPDC047049]|uniref:SH3 domain-containing protein n=1 Tax=Streptomyces sp. NPDC047049 TaxID=3156688 RepID=UPI0033D8C33C